MNANYQTLSAVARHNDVAGKTVKAVMTRLRIQPAAILANGTILIDRAAEQAIAKALAENRSQAQSPVLLPPDSSPNFGVQSVDTTPGAVC